MTLTVTTNGHARPLVSLIWDDAQGEWREPVSEEDYEQAENDFTTGFRYRGTLYWLSDFEHINRGISVPVVAPTDNERDEIAEWDGVQGTSAFSAMAVRIVDDGDAVVVAQLTW